MNFTGNENHDFPLDTASIWTANYRNANPGAIIAHYFGKTAITNILSQQGCVGLRIYYALDSTEKKQLIITGVDGNGNDLYTGQLAERSITCPIDCSAANPLNT